MRKTMVFIPQLALAVAALLVSPACGDSGSGTTDASSTTPSSGDPTGSSDASETDPSSSEGTGTETSAGSSDTTAGSSSGDTTTGSTSQGPGGTTAAETTDPDVMMAQMICREICGLQGNCMLITIDEQIECEVTCDEINAVCADQQAYNDAVIACLGVDCSEVPACIDALPDC